ncbi:MAG: hypothetical protein NTZ08_05470 [Verrucomicrobia bacterium]|nr:hypothetical protein [Verrucomicrobiota bacterium]
MSFVMNFQTTPRWIILASFSFLTAALAAPEADAGQPTQEITKGNATAASPTPKPTPTADEEEEQEIRRNRQFLGEPARATAPVQTRMLVGREIPVATQYAPPRITPQADGGYVVQPATPTAFETRQTGMTIDATGFEETEIEGFIDYGSPIRTALPIYNEKGEIIGTTIQEHPNPILQPVFRTIRKE